MNPRTWNVSIGGEQRERYKGMGCLCSKRSHIKSYEPPWESNYGTFTVQEDKDTSNQQPSKDVLVSKKMQKSKQSKSEKSNNCLCVDIGAHSSSMGFWDPKKSRMTWILADVSGNSSERIRSLIIKKDINKYRSDLYGNALVTLEGNNALKVDHLFDQDSNLAQYLWLLLNSSSFAEKNYSYESVLVNRTAHKVAQIQNSLEMCGIKESSIISSTLCASAAFLFEQSNCLPFQNLKNEELTIVDFGHSATRVGFVKIKIHPKKGSFMVQVVEENLFNGIRFLINEFTRQCAVKMAKHFGWESTFVAKKMEGKLRLKYRNFFETSFISLLSDSSFVRLILSFTFIRLMLIYQKFTILILSWENHHKRTVYYFHLRSSCRH